MTPLVTSDIQLHIPWKKYWCIFVYAGVAELILIVIIVELFIHEMCPMVARFLKYPKLKMACQEELKE